MRTTMLIAPLAAVAALGVPLSPHTASATACLDAVRAEYLDCRDQCRDDFLVAKDACMNRDHECVQACRADREDCRAATGIDEDLAVCEARLETDKQRCRDRFPPLTPERDRCIDQAQVVAFQCRDAAREAARPALDVCRAAFLTCARGCPEAGRVVIDRRQCRIDAKVAYRARKAQCKEDRQVGKDACLNRDHACVEQCRSDRAACRQPILDVLLADIAACNARRDADIGNCRLLYPEGGPQLDQCIDNAQVAAFVCRDEARERARPGLQECRRDFLECVRACPPPASPSGAFLEAVAGSCG